MFSVSISFVLGICLNWNVDVEIESMAGENQENIGRSKSPDLRHLFVTVLLIGLALSASYAGYLGARSAYSQLRTLVSRLTGTNNQPIQSANGSVCWSTSSSDGLVLQATLANGGRTVTVAMVVDTGAYISAAPRQLATELGINPYSGNPVELGSVYGQSEVGYVHTVSLTLSNMHTVEIPIAIMLSNSVPYVLGRQGFLNQFSLQVEQSSGMFCLKQN
jgi:predicted aspartyl protease